MGGYLERMTVRAMTSAELARELEFVHARVTASGVRVTPELAMQYAAVFACVRVTSEDVAKLPLILQRRLKNGGKERATDHPKYGLLHDRPNSWMTSYEWREMLNGHNELRGGAFAFKNIVRGDLRELLPIDPRRVTVRQDDRYKITYKIDGYSDVFTEAEIFHVRGLSSDGVNGLSPISLHRESIGLGMVTLEHGAQLFGNGAQPGGILEVPGKLNEAATQRLQDSAHEKFGGEMRFKTMVLEQGAKWHQIGLSSEDAQYLETRKFQVTEIARIYRVPPHKIMDLERATFSNIEAQERAYVQDALLPRLERWRQRLNISLLTPAERETYSFDFVTEGLLQGLTLERYQAYAAACGGAAPWMARNEARIKEGLNPLPGLDEILQPMNMAPAGSKNTTVDDSQKA